MKEIEIYVSPEDSSQYLKVVRDVLHSTNITGFTAMNRLNLMAYVKQDSLWHSFHLSDILLLCLVEDNVKLSFHVYRYILATCNATIFSGFIIVVFLNVKANVSALGYHTPVVVVAVKENTLGCIFKACWTAGKLKVWTFIFK